MATEVGLVEAYVQVGPDSTGKKIRNLVVTVPQPDGSTTQAYMQVVGLADANGFPVPWPTDALNEVLAELRSTRRLLALGFAGMGIDGVDIEGTDTERED